MRIHALVTVLSLALLTHGSAVNAQTNSTPTAPAQSAASTPGVVYGDARFDAPELAARGKYAVGVRTITATNRDQLDILKLSATAPNPRVDRTLTLEVWYPARVPAGQAELTTYRDVLGAGANDPKRPNTPFEFAGRALRDAQPDTSVGRAPLVIVSHGYPGSRLMMSYLTENLASKGYVVVAIDHTESTRADRAGFASTLLNRPLDQLFVLDHVAGLGRAGSGSFLSGLVDADRTALIGYSMGGYGALNAAGAGFSETAVNYPWAVPAGKLAARQMGNPEFTRSADPRIKAVVAFAPWGAQLGFWDAAGMAGLKVPTLFITGDQDDVSGFAEGPRRLFEGAVNADRYMLVYQNARHNVAPNPAPPAASSHPDDFMAYSEPAWDSRRMNNINQHFVTAFLGTVLRAEPLGPYLDLVPKAIEGKTSRNADGTTKPDHTYWKGFMDRTAVGLEFYRLKPR